MASEVYDALEAAGSQIPFPQRDLHLVSMDGSVADKFRGDRGDS